MAISVSEQTDDLVSELRLKSIDSVSEQKEIKTVDGEVDAGLSALTGAKTSAAFTAAEKQYGGVFRDLGEYSDGASAYLALDATQFGLIDQQLGGAKSTSAAQTDFLAFDKDLRAAAHGLGGLGGDLYAMGGLVSQSGLAGDEKKTASAAASLKTQFATLSGDVTKIVHDLKPSSGGANAQAAVTTTSPYAGVAAALSPLAAEFEALSIDYGHLSSLLSGTGTSGGSGPSLSAAVVSGGANPLTYDGVFASIDTDFLALDKSLMRLAGPLANLIAGSSSTPTTSA